ncbi:MAG TPA: hypothetical protein VK661_09370 [Planctomycetota bacterium]|nr:hypothetical protein [Planctomycetota bacterium]
MPKTNPDRQEVLRRWPRITAHVIAESLGYAAPGLAAKIVADAACGRPNYCEWIDCCYRGNAPEAVRSAIRHRHRHHGPMAEFRQALALVRHCAQTGEELLFASWF